MTKARLLSAVAATALVAVGCGMLTGPDEDGDRLAIERFTASPSRIDSGARTMLLWSVAGADFVTIDQGIGEVEASGSMQVSPRSTTTYTLSAEGGTSSATSSVVVSVGGTGASPSPSPSPSPSASPSPSPSPSPSATPGPVPSPSPTPGAATCGKQQATFSGCRLTVTSPSALGPGECAQLTRLAAEPTCPLQTGMIRTISFDIFAQSGQPLSWRRAAGGQDAVSPAGGALNQGHTTATTTAVVYDASLTFEVVNQSGTVLMRFTLDHR